MTTSNNTATNTNNTYFNDGTFSSKWRLPISRNAIKRRIEYITLPDFYEDDKEEEQENQEKYNKLYRQFYKHRDYSMVIVKWNVILRVER